MNMSKQKNKIQVYHTIRGGSINPNANTQESDEVPLLLPTGGSAIPEFISPDEAIKQFYPTRSPLRVDDDGGKLLPLMDK